MFHTAISCLNLNLLDYLLPKMRKGMKWLEEKAEDSGTMDNYMDTCKQSKNENTRNSQKSWWASRDLNPGPDDYESSALTN